MRSWFAWGLLRAGRVYRYRCDLLRLSKALLRAVNDVLLDGNLALRVNLGAALALAVTLHPAAPDTEHKAVDTLPGRPAKVYL